MRVASAAKKNAEASDDDIIDHFEVVLAADQRQVKKSAFLS